MKKQAMSLAVTAALLGGAVSATGQSMYINEGGLGETLIYPFYSAANGNDTYVHIVNTTDRTKAVKVRFIEAQNSDEVLDFNLYLSPEDEWAGVITRNPLLGSGNGAIIRTVDNSCTVPAFGVEEEATDTTPEVRSQAFVNSEYADDIDDSVARTLEGYIEMIEMGQLDASSGFGADAVHNAVGVPANCAALVAAWTKPINPSATPNPTGAWISNADDELLTTWEGGGLYGYSVLINPDEGTAVGVDATAIAEFANTFNGGLPIPSLHSDPGDILPGLASGTEFVTVFVDGQSETLEMSTGLDAVSALFMTTGIINDYVVDPAINAMTDWVVTMPTKKAYTNGSAALAPFSSTWGPNDDETADVACEPVSMDFWDREEAYEPPGTDGPVFSPKPDTPTSKDLVICTEVSVITFGSDSAVQATDSIRYGINEILDYTEGWAILDFTGDQLNTPLPSPARELASVSGETFIGLPATGFAVFEYTNGSIIDPVDGIVKANYEAAVDHKTIIEIID